MPKPPLKLLKSEALHKAEQRWNLNQKTEEVAADIFLCRSCDELLPRGQRECKNCKIEEMGDAGPLDIA